MIKIAALTSGKNTPSSRYRIRQHIALLKKAGIDISEFYPCVEKYSSMPEKQELFCKKHHIDSEKWWIRLKKTDRLYGFLSSFFYDIVWLERVMIPRYKSFEYKRIGTEFKTPAYTRRRN